VFNLIILWEFAGSVRSQMHLSPEENTQRKWKHNMCARPSQTDRRTNIMAIARRFLLWTHRALKIN